MMLFKLSLKNMKKSFKDYAIYFLTLILGVAIFYMFNSIDSQEAMLQISKSTRDIIKLMIELLGMVSVFVAVILGFLIVYANNFLIKRRKKEFGIYMTLGMGKSQISKILFLETLIVGIVSLVVGLTLGIFGSQLMSILVAKMFEADMSKFEFAFSGAACVKTCIYFAIMYLAVMVFNTISISKYKLIDLITAVKKNEKVRIKNPVVSILIFLIAASMLGYAYYIVTFGVMTLNTVDKLIFPIILGVVGTFLVFWSLSGFVLKLVQSRKKIYLKDTNMFVLRQLNNKINTTVVSMTFICLMLFMTITILSSALSLRNSITKDLVEMTPVDINLYKSANLTDESKYTKEQIDDSKLTIKDTLVNNGFDISNLKDIIEIGIYETDGLKWKDSLSSIYPEIKEEYPLLNYEAKETIVKVSDYNKIAKLYGIEQYDLNDEEYIVLCDFTNMENMRNKALSNKSQITINGQKLYSRYDKCMSGFIVMSTSHTNTGIILVPDTLRLGEDMRKRSLLVANYNAQTDEEKQAIEEILVDEDSEFVKQVLNKGIKLDGETRISLIEASVGLATIVTFIAIYLGIIFLIASSALLALKELTESSDNKQRYTILRKIGVDEKMINKSLLKQIGIFFIIPLLLAIVHSIFGIQFALSIISMQVKPQELMPSIIATSAFLIFIYGAYFIATYTGSKNIIKED